jgi:hypothetical protein
MESLCARVLTRASETAGSVGVLASVYGISSRMRDLRDSGMYSCLSPSTAYLGTRRGVSTVRPVSRVPSRCTTLTSLHPAGRWRADNHVDDDRTSCGNRILLSSRVPVLERDERRPGRRGSGSGVFAFRYSEPPTAASRVGPRGRGGRRRRGLHTYNRTRLDSSFLRI